MCVCVCVWLGVNEPASVSDRDMGRRGSIEGRKRGGKETWREGEIWREGGIEGRRDVEGKRCEWRNGKKQVGET